MAWQYTPYTIGLVAAAALMLAVVVYGVRSTRDDGPDPVVVAFSALVAGVAIWAVGYGFQLASVGFEAKYVWRSVGYVGHNVVPVSLLVFCLLYTGHEQWVSKRNTLVLAAEPFVVGVLLTPTNALHSLVWRDLSLGTAGSITVLERAFGPLYLLNTAYNYALVIAAVGVVALAFVQASNRQYRWQTGLLLFGVLPTLAANVVWVASLTAIDYTPAALTITGLAFAAAVFRFRLLDLVPIARSRVVQGMRDGYVVLDADDVIVDSNPVATNVLGRTRLVGEPAIDVLPEPIRTLIDCETVAETDFSVTAPDGPRYYDVQLSVLGDEAATGRLLLFRDVTDRRSAERRFQSLIEHASDVITVLDADMEITYASPSVRRVMGYDPESLVGRNALSMVHPEDEANLADAFERSRADPEAIQSIEYRLRGVDGDWRWLETRGRNRFDDPAIEGFVCNSRDVTDRKRRERDLERQNERLDEFAGVVSHDLRNPINVIDGYLTLVRETGDREALDAIDRATDRMASIIEDVLVLARQGHAIDRPEPVALGDVVTDAWAVVDTERATLDFEGELPVVSADPDRLQGLFENLFRNAVEHGGMTVEITVGGTENGFYLADDGPGIPAAERGSVFEHGYTTSATGTGFGLAIVRTIAQAHGWDVRVIEASTGGARFEVIGVSQPAPMPAIAEATGGRGD